MLLSQHNIAVTCPFPDEFDVSNTHLCSRVLNQFLRIPFAPRIRLGANVNEIPRTQICFFAQDFVLCFVQERHELGEEALLAF